MVVTRDLFNSIDIRKDGVIDIKEWTSQLKSSSSSVAIKEDETWEDSKEYENVLKMINKNRRYLDMFFAKKALKEMNQKEERVLIRVKDVREIIKELFKANKVTYKKGMI